MKKNTFFVLLWMLSVPAGLYAQTTLTFANGQKVEITGQLTGTLTTPEDVTTYYYQLIDNQLHYWEYSDVKINGEKYAVYKVIDVDKAFVAHQISPKSEEYPARVDIYCVEGAGDCVKTTNYSNGGSSTSEENSILLIFDSDEAATEELTKLKPILKKK
ncbi:MAG TPA: hypothetical protein DCM08_07730 [Microscillaceae bacterium]|nr:hypothetical protein [Microscillaceae bacterium]